MPTLPAVRASRSTAAEVKKRFATQFAADETDEQRGPLSTSEAVERRRWRRIVGGCLPELPDPDLAFAELWEHFGDAGHWRVFPDVQPAVLALQKLGVRLCIASNFDARLRPVVRGLEELSGWAEPLIISSEVGYRKPHPRFYEAACERLGLPAQNVLFVGDDLENDVLGPTRAGFLAILLDRGLREPSVQAFLRSLMELPRRLASKSSAAC